jgi:hypothetical protein
MLAYFTAIWYFMGFRYVYFSRFGLFVPRDIWQPCCGVMLPTANFAQIMFWLRCLVGSVSVFGTEDCGFESPPGNTV